MKKLLMAILLAFPLLAYGQAPAVIPVDSDPAGGACTLQSPPILLVYSLAATQEICTCIGSIWDCEDMDGGGGGGSPGGVATSVQYTTDGVTFDGEAAFTYTESTDTLICPIIEAGTSLEVASGVTIGQFDELTDVPAAHVGVFRSASGIDFTANGNLVLRPRTDVAQGIDFYDGASTRAMLIEGDGDIQLPQVTASRCLGLSAGNVITAAAEDCFLSTDINTFAELDAIVTDQTLVHTASAVTWTGDHAFTEFSTGANAEFDAEFGGATLGGIRIGNTGLHGSSFAASGLDLGGAMLIRQQANLEVGNDPGIEFAIMEQGNTVRLAIPESAAGNATAFIRSGTFAGPYSGVTGNDTVLCDTWTAFDTNIDCDTSGTGADLFVQDDLEVEGTVYAHESINLEGATADGNQVTISVGADPGADVALTLPTVAGAMVSEASAVTWTGDHNFQGAVDLEGEVRFDNDGDSDYDVVYVGMDYDGLAAGSMELDLDAAIDDYCPANLCPEPGLKMIVLPGDYVAPGADVSGNTNGILDLPGNFTLECMPGALLRGFEDTDTTSTQAVITARGRDNLTIKGCAVDGGSTLASVAVAGARMGIYIQNNGATSSTDIRIIGNTIINTDHTGIYAKNTERFMISDNVIDGTDDQPCYYIYADNGDTTKHGLLSNNICLNSGNNGINFRRDSASETIENVFGIGNVIDTVSATGFCITADGAWHSGFIGTICKNGKGFSAGNASANEYWDDGTPTNTSATVDFQISGLNVEMGTSTPCMVLGSYHDGLQVSDVTCIGDDGTTAGQDGVEINQPQRRLNLSNIQIKEIGDDAFLIVNNSGTAIDETYDIGPFHVEGIGGSMIQTSGSLTMTRWDWHDFKAVDVAVVSNMSGVVSDTTWRNGFVDMNDVSQNAFLQYIVAAHSQVQHDNILCIDVENGWCIRVNSGSCDDCSYSRITAVANASVNMQGAVHAGNSSPVYLSDIHCVGETSTCVSNVSGALTMIGGVQEASARWLADGNTSANDCPTTAGKVANGDTCFDTDGDGSTACVGATLECFEFVRTGGAWRAVEF